LAAKAITVPIGTTFCTYVSNVSNLSESIFILVFNVSDNSYIVFELTKLCESFVGLSSNGNDDGDNTISFLSF
jgi:hypothetical protein